jgi:SagB-type dehydrogenase family enzyme
VAYDDVFASHAVTGVPLNPVFLGDLLRHSLGLSAWKRIPGSQWSLRVNPSSGNLHPTEAYVVVGPDAGLMDAAAVYHYAPESHALEVRCRFDRRAWVTATDNRPLALVALTSIHWREAWKYGERAFRYCQHDLGHAVATVRIAAAILGWRAAILPSWSHRAVALLTGVDRDDDFVEVEREEPGCVIALTPSAIPATIADGDAEWLEAVRGGQWTGRASQLSEAHVQWTFIDEIAAATRDPGRRDDEAQEKRRPEERVAEARDMGDERDRVERGDARAVVLQRRSAVAFHPAPPPLKADTFFAMLRRVVPAGGVPWDAMWWTPRIHLLLFVHRVEHVAPGLYLLGRDPDGFARLQAALGSHLTRERADDRLPLVRLASGDCRRVAERLSCDQAIAGDGFFSVGMLADFDASLEAFGPAFYRHLFWESGIVGQMLYLEAEAAGARGTGIGCFYDDGVHDVLGLAAHAFQSLYHFTIGVAVEDRRLTTSPGYTWESC